MSKGVNGNRANKSHTETLLEEWFEKVVSSVEAGHAPWVKPWNGTPIPQAQPMRVVGGELKPYAGMYNRWSCAMDPHKSNVFGTFKQFKAAGNPIKKGSKSSVILFRPNMRKVEDQKSGEERMAMFGFIPFRAFNAEQTEQGDIWTPKAGEATPNQERQLDEAVTKGMDSIMAYFDSPFGATLGDAGGDAAFYRPSTDTVTMPFRQDFKACQEWLSTLIHEAAHSTGHKKREDRLEPTFFGTETYSFEELVAEFTAAEYMARLGLANARLLENSEAYIKNWALKLKAMGPAGMKKAITKANRAIKWIEDPAALAATKK